MVNTTFSEQPPQQLQPEKALIKIANEAGEQTQLAENVRKIAAEIDPEGSLTGLDLIQKICDCVNTMLPKPEELADLYNKSPRKRFDKRERTADELLSKENLLPDRPRTRNISGCIETGVVTRALLLAEGIACIYTETLQKDWCDTHGKDYDPEAENPTVPMEGHVFIDFYDKESEQWYTLDPNKPRGERIRPYQDYQKNGKKYIHPMSAADSWGLGFRNMRDFKRAVANLLSG